MKNADLDRAYRYAWDWFEYHAKQRLTTFNFFLIIIGAMGYVYIFGCIDSDLKIWLAFFGAGISFLFLLLEVRNTILVDDGRKALDKLEKDEPFNEMLIRKADLKRFRIEKKENNQKILFWQRIGFIFSSHTLCLRLILSVSIWICLSIAFKNMGKFGVWYNLVLYGLPIAIFIISILKKSIFGIFRPKLLSDD